LSIYVNVSSRGELVTAVKAGGNKFCKNKNRKGAKYSGNFINNINIT